LGKINKARNQKIKKARKQKIKKAKNQKIKKARKQESKIFLLSFPQSPESGNPFHY